jgi:hypothetical protein
MTDVSANVGAEQPGAQEGSGDDQLRQLQQQMAAPLDPAPQRASARRAAGAATPAAAGIGRELSKKLTEEEARQIVTSDGVLNLGGKEFTVDENCEDRTEGIFSHHNKIYYAEAARQLEEKGCSEDIQCIFSRLQMDAIKESAERTKTSLPQFIAIMRLDPEVLKKYVNMVEGADVATVGDLVALLDLAISPGGVTAEDVGSPGSSGELEARIAQLHRGYRFLRDGQQRDNRARRVPQEQVGSQWQYYTPFGGITGGEAQTAAEPSAATFGLFAEAVQNASPYSLLTTRDAKSIEDDIDDDGRCNFRPETLNLLLGCGSDTQKFKHMVLLPLEATL